MTTRQLLTNRSGSPHYEHLDDWDDTWSQAWKDRWSTWRGRRDAYYDTARPWNPDASIAFFKDAPLLFEPGTAYEYSTFGFNLAATVAEYVGRDAANRGFVRLVRDKIANPLGMTTLQPDYSEFQTLADRTSGYRMSCNAWPLLEGTDAGHALVDVETYVAGDGTQRWAGVWRASSDDDRLQRDQSMCGLLGQHRTNASAGYRLVDLEVYR